MTIRNLLTANQVADILQVSPRTLAYWRTNNHDDLPFVRIGNRTIRYRTEDVEDFVDSDEFEGEEYDD